MLYDVAEINAYQQLMYSNVIFVSIFLVSIWPLCKKIRAAILLGPVSLDQPRFVLVASRPITPREKDIQKWIWTGLVGDSGDSF